MNVTFKASLVVFMIFVVGFLAGIGSVATFLAVKGPPLSFGAPDMSGPPFMARPEARLERMARKLDLSLEQQEKIQPVLEQARRELEAFRVKTAPQMKAIFKKTEQQIRDLLTSEQRERFDRFVQRREKHFKKRMRRFGKGMPPGPFGERGDGERPQRMKRYESDGRDVQR
ncbi:MAG: hypothetical protein GY868_03480 [Deltaproteobacteria bacterium]|nr:hypothetical protein [Deltaproteobacteria bacterium]